MKTEGIIERSLSAMEMPPSQLIQTYRESLKIERNPLSEIYEREILGRLYLLNLILERRRGKI